MFNILTALMMKLKAVLLESLVKEIKMRSYKTYVYDDSSE